MKGWCVTIVSAAAVVACAGPKRTWSQQIGAVFPPAPAQPLVGVVDDRFVVRGHLEGHDLAELEVIPKIWLAEEPGKALGPPPTMSKEEFRNLLSRVERVRPLGDLVGEGKVATVQAVRSWITDEYAGALVDRFLWDRQLAACRIFFIRTITGRVESIRPTSSLFNFRYDSVEIGGRMYWVRTTEAADLKPGTVVRVRGAGPIGQHSARDQ
jgi:hypothetical protein